MMRRPIRIVLAVLGLAGCTILGFVAGQLSSAPAAFADVGLAVPSIAFDGALDGDTIIDEGRAVHIRGMDAPELGPWAKCWAEAALAGHARDNLQSLLNDNDRRGWRWRNLSRVDEKGNWSAHVVDRQGFDIVDSMVVSGFAAKTAVRWDWCGKDSGLRQVMDGDKPPHGPSLWWPTGRMYDPRALD